MRLRGGQARFLFGMIALWSGVRAAMLWRGEGVEGVPIAARVVKGERSRVPSAIGTSPPPPTSVHMFALSRPIPSSQRRLGSLSADARAGAVRGPSLRWGDGRVDDGDRLAVEDGPTSLAGAQPDAPSTQASAGIPAAPPFAATLPAHAVPATSRWSGSAYLFLRPGSGRPSLAAGGELGGSQAAARLAYRLNAGAVTRLALASRLYAPIGAKGAEAAAGLDWYPVAGVPVRVSVERRMGLDRAGRNAWSAYAAGGFYLERFGGHVAIDGYGQAGVVGTQRRDLFADGALRAGRRLALGRSSATIGAGIWGAAQPGVARFDIGPRAAMTLPLGPTSASLAVEGRFRVAGRASPGSGVVLTLAGQF